MRQLFLATIFSTVLLLSHTAVQAQENRNDDFEAFRNKFNTAITMGRPIAKSGYGATPQTPEELQAMMEQEQEQVKFSIIRKIVTDMEGAKQRAERLSHDFDGMLEADSKITAVTVYNTMAKVTRTAVVDVPKGDNTVVFKNLPSSLIFETLRAQGKADAQVTFGAVMNKKFKLARLPTVEEFAIYDKFRPLTDQKRMIEAERLGLEVKKIFLMNLGQQAATTANEDFKRNELKPAQWAAAANELQAGFQDALKASVALDIKERDLEREIMGLRNDVLQIRPGQRDLYAAIVPLHAENATKLTIELTYQVSRATWVPVYDARLNAGADESLHLTQYGTVRQMTGEDWEGVALTLSTARPAMGSDTRELSPQWVNAVPAPPPGTVETIPPSGDPLAQWRQKAEARRLSLESSVAPETEYAPVPMVTPIRPQATLSFEARFTPATADNGGYVTEYKIPGAARVLSDDSETRLLIGNFEADAAMEVQVKPQLTTEASLIAQIKLKGDAPLLPGTVNLFRDGSYIGSTPITLVQPNEEYGLYFGIDDLVKIKHRMLQDENKEEGMISKDNLIERQYVTEIQNLHTSPMKLVVKDIIPSSKNEKVAIDVHKDFTTPGYVADAANIKGQLIWKFDMAPQEKKDLKLGWTVTWPKDYRLQGL